MKRLMFLCSLLFGVMGSVMADHWTVNYQESANDVRTETYVLTRFQVPDGDSWQNYVGTNYEIAAFIDG